MREWTEKHIRELVDDEYKKINMPSPSPQPVPTGGNIINYNHMFGIGPKYMEPPAYWHLDYLMNEDYMINWVEYIGDITYDNKKWSRYRWIRYENGDPIAKRLPPLREQKAIRYNGQVVPLLGFTTSDFGGLLPAVLGYNNYNNGETRIFAMKDGLKFPVLKIGSRRFIDDLFDFTEGDGFRFPEIIQYDPSNNNVINRKFWTDFVLMMFAIDPTERPGYDHWDYAQGTVYNCELYFDVYKSR